jgi:hypothetical protein
MFRSALCSGGRHRRPDSLSGVRTLAATGPLSYGPCDRRPASIRKWHSKRGGSSVGQPPDRCFAGRLWVR